MMLSISVVAMLKLSFCPTTKSTRNNSFTNSLNIWIKISARNIPLSNNKIIWFRFGNGFNRAAKETSFIETPRVTSCVRFCKSFCSKSARTDSFRGNWLRWYVCLSILASCQTAQGRQVSVNFALRSGKPLSLPQHRA